ncbi:metal ABC transporter solute-binding protein, Zn/Mn family [Pseudonocardia nantongensis]|uniref:metal ABC transporter solute-binding protein, Zn/Mn family n=1 Tax=Pseudonocardia nantongensis TaxID=1181885 RepID=UPI0039786A8C
MSRTPFRPAGLVAGLAALALGLSACGGSADQGAPAQDQQDPEQQQLPVVASTDAWGSVARAIGGNFVRVEPIIDSPGQDPHGYEATPRDATTIGDGRLILRNGGGYDDFMTGLIDASGNAAPVIDAVQVSGLGDAEDAEGAAAGHEHGHDEAGHAHGGSNEHVWYSPATVEKVGQALARELGTLDPANAQYYSTNAQALSGGIAQLTSKATDIGRQHPGARVVVTEPVPEYLLDAAGVQNVTPQEFSSAVEEGTDPPAAVVAQTLGLFGAQPPVDALVLNGQTQSAATDQVRDAAEQAGVPVVEMSETLPDGVTDYMQWMNTNLDALDGALTR